MYLEAGLLFKQEAEKQFEGSSKRLVRSIRISGRKVRMLRTPFENAFGKRKLLLQKLQGFHWFHHVLTSADYSLVSRCLQNADLANNNPKSAETRQGCELPGQSLQLGGKGACPAGRPSYYFPTVGNCCVLRAWCFADSWAELRVAGAIDLDSELSISPMFGSHSHSPPQKKG